MYPAGSLAHAPSASLDDLGEATSNKMDISKTSSSRTLLIVTFLGFVFSFTLFIFSISLKGRVESSSVPSVEDVTIQEKVDSPLPMRLKIPKIGVDAKVDPMGITKSGALEAPVGGKNVGWYESGPQPGDIGSAVIDGHFGRWKNGEGSVFDNLNKLQKGDNVYVEDEKGGVATFVVREFRTYDPKADTSDVFSSDDGKSHLNLITCEGIWNKDSKSYSARLVVFTDKE